jgi:hypothetical protein
VAIRNHFLHRLHHLKYINPCKGVQEDPHTSGAALKQAIEEKRNWDQSWYP